MSVSEQAFNPGIFCATFDTHETTAAVMIRPVIMGTLPYLRYLSAKITVVFRHQDWADPPRDVSACYQTFKSTSSPGRICILSEDGTISVWCGMSFNTAAMVASDDTSRCTIDGWVKFWSSGDVRYLVLNVNCADGRRPQKRRSGPLATQMIGRICA